MTAQLAPIAPTEDPVQPAADTAFTWARRGRRNERRSTLEPRWRTPWTIVDRSAPAWSTEADFGIRHTSAVDLPDVVETSRTFATSLVEVMSGRRAQRQLRSHCAPEVFGGLWTLMAVAPTEPPRLLSLHVSEPTDGIAEVCASFRRGTRVAAMAFRLQGIDGRWRMTDLQVG